MEATIGCQANIIRSIQAEPTSYQFYQAVRLIERYLLSNKGQLNFRVQPQLAFAVSDFNRLNFSENDKTLYVELFITFFGLIGQSGVLPEFYTEYIIVRLREKDSSLLAFLDIFHDQFFSLLYEVGNFSHFYIAYESQRQHPLLDLLKAFVGQNTAQLEEPLFAYANLFGNQARSIECLKNLLANYFELQVAIYQYEPEWLYIEPDVIARFSRDKKIYLSHSTILGKRIWQVQNCFHVILGPLSWEQFSSLLPNGDLLPILTRLIQAYVGLEFDYIIQLIIMNDKLPMIKISNNKAAKLGWNTRLTSCIETQKHSICISHHKIKGLRK
jgi:type VI secretion system protein ImpH